MSDELEDDFFGGFGICDDSDGNEEFVPKKSQQTIADIAKEIGSFDKWPELAPELKMVVVSHLDFITRTRLSFCSRKDYDIVNSSPVQISSIEIKDNGDEDYYISTDPIDNVSVRIEYGDGKTEKNKVMKHLHFVKRGENDTDIGWMARPARKRPFAKFNKLEGRDNYEEAVKFVEKWLKKSRYGVKSLTVEMKRWPFETSEIQHLPHCDNIRICYEDETAIKWWLQKVRPNLESLEISNRYSEVPLTSEFLSMEHFKLSNRLHIWGVGNFTDEQFLSLKGKRISVESNTITDQAMNKWMKNWIDGKVRPDFEIFTVWITRAAVKTELLKNITFRPWDEDFEEEARGFCGDWARVMGRRDCNQIKKGDSSGSSATLDISDDRITFAITGMKMEWNGQVYINYGIP